MRHLLTGLFIIFFSMCAITGCVHPVGSITREDIENSGGGGNSGGGSDNPGSGNPGNGNPGNGNPGSDGDGVFINTTGTDIWQ